MNKRSVKVAKEGETPRQQAARRTARRLQERLLRLPEGELLGVEEDLLAELGISRDTLRQAMRLLEADGLVRVKRGMRGGFFARRPDESSVVRAATLYLRTRNVTILDAMAVIAPLLVDAARQAASSEDEVLRSQLREIVEEIAIFSPSQDSPGELLRSSTAFMNCMLAMAGNPMLELYVRCASQFGLAEASVEMANDVELIAVRHKGMLLLGEALLRGDAEVAALVQARQLKSLDAAMRLHHSRYPTPRATETETD